MKKSLITKLFVLLLLSPLCGIAQLTNSDNFGAILYEKDSVNFGGTSLIHVTNNNKYVIGDDYGYLQIFEVDVETGMPVEYYTVDHKDEVNINNYDIVSGIAVTSDDSLIVISGKNRVQLYSFDAQNGACQLQSIFDLPEGHSCTAITISNDDRYLFITDNDVVFIYSLNVTDGQASLKASQDLDLNKDLFVENSSFNERLLFYAKNDTRMYVYVLDSHTFELTQESVIEADIDNEVYVRSITALESDTRGNLYVTSAIDSSFAVFSFSETEKVFKPKYAYTGLPFVMDVAVDPSEGIIFVLTNPYIHIGLLGCCSGIIPPFEESVHYFSRGNDNEFSYIGKKQFQDDEMNVAYSITVSPNGKFLYEGLWSNVMVGKLSLGAFPNLGENIYACEGETVHVSLDKIYPSVQWSTGDAGGKDFVVVSDTVLSVEVIDDYGRKGFDTVTVRFEKGIEFLSGRNITVTQGEEMVIELADSYSSYKWSNGSAEAILSITADQFDTGPDVTADTSLVVEVVSENGCKMSDTLFISVDPTPQGGLPQYFEIADIIETANSVKIKGEKCFTTKIYTVAGVMVYDAGITKRRLTIPKAELPQGILVVGLVSKFGIKTKIISNF